MQESRQEIEERGRFPNLIYKALKSVHRMDVACKSWFLLRRKGLAAMVDVDKAKETGREALQLETSLLT
jgi:hypothetical protein